MSEPLQTWVLDRLAQTRSAIADLKPAPADKPFWQIQMAEVRTAIAELQQPRCVRCGEAFTPVNAYSVRQKYCGKPCRLAASNEARRMNDGPTQRPARKELWLVLQSIESVWRVGSADILSKRRAHSLTWPRHMAMTALRHVRPDVSLPRVGRMFGRDHSSVIHAIDQHAKRLADPAYAAKWAAVLEKMGARP